MRKERRLAVHGQGKEGRVEKKKKIERMEVKEDNRKMRERRGGW